MSKENAIKKIRENLKKLLSFSNEKFGTLVLSDGTSVSISSTDLEIGAEIFMLDELNNQTPCDNGDYVLQDGRSFTVTDGKITDIKETDPTAEKPANGDTSTDKPATMASADGLPAGHTGDQAEGDKPTADAGGEMSSRVEALEKSVAEILNILSKMGDSQNEVNEQMMAKIKKFGSEPGDEPVRTGKKGYSAYDSKKAGKTHQDIEELRGLMKQMRKIG